MALNTWTVLGAIGHTEPSTFGELCQGLGNDKPEDKDEWRTLFRWIERLENLGYLEVDRIGPGKIDSLIVTDEGADFLRNNPAPDRRG